MADVLITGGGLGGLLTSLLLAQDGHDVTVIERDPAPPPDPDTSWNDWERRGVNQFRLGHLFLARFAALIKSELPSLVGALEDAGALRFNPIELIPPEMTGGVESDDVRFEAITARRPVMEAVVAKAVADQEKVTVRRGVSVKGLLNGTPAQDGTPNITGVKLDDGTELSADLVVDATGRRSPLPSWLAGLDARPPQEELEDSGFIYYGRHFRSSDGSVPPLLGPLLQDYGSVSSLTLPADNGTWAVIIVASARDAALRGLRDPAHWGRAVASFPLVAHWLEGEPLEDRVVTMSKIEDRHRRYVLDATPVATGVLAVADSWACTNPSLGRGVSMAMIHAVALRDLLRSAPDDPVELALRWDLSTQEIIEPWYRSTLAYDRHRLHEIDAEIEEAAYRPDDPSWELTKALIASSAKDPDCLRAQLSVGLMVELPETVLADTMLMDKVISLGAGWRDEPVLGPSRKELVSIANGSTTNR